MFFFSFNHILAGTHRANAPNRGERDLHTLHQGSREIACNNKKKKYLAVHSVELVVEGHGEVGGGAGGHVCDKGRLALVDRVVHVDTALADLHVLEARLDAAQG